MTTQRIRLAWWKKDAKVKSFWRENEETLRVEFINQKHPSVVEYHDFSLEELEKVCIRSGDFYNSDSGLLWDDGGQYYDISIDFLFDINWNLTPYVQRLLHEHIDAYNFQSLTFEQFNAAPVALKEAHYNLMTERVGRHRYRPYILKIARCVRGALKPSKAFPNHKRTTQFIHKMRKKNASKRKITHSLSA